MILLEWILIYFHKMMLNKGTIIARQWLQTVSSMLLIIFSMAGCAPVTTNSTHNISADIPEQADSVAVHSAEPSVIDFCASTSLSSESLFKLLIAELSGQRGEYALSVQYYLDLARQGCAVEIAQRATRIAIFSRDYAAAAEAAKLWLQHEQDNAEIYQILATSAIATQDIEQAIEYMRKMLDLSQGNFDQKLWTIVNFLNREGNEAAFNQVIERLMQDEQTNPEVLFIYAQISIISGHFSRAEGLLQQLMQDRPDNNKIIFAYLNLLQARGDSTQAVTWLQTYLAERSDDFELRYAYAQLLIENEQFRQALEQYHLLLETSPEHVDVLYSLGVVYLRLNNYAKAQQYFLQLNSMHRYVYESNYYLGRIAEYRENFSKALDWYAGVQEGRYYLDAQIRVSILFAKQGQLQEGLTRIRQISSNNPQALTLLAQAEAEILVNAERFEAAMSVFDQALHNDPSNHDLLYSRAMLAEKISRLDIMERDLNILIQQDPKHAQALNALGYTLADKTDRHQEAYILIKRALELNPNDFHILDSMGWVLYRLGRLDEAINYLRAALRLRRDPEISAHLSEVLWVKGDKQAAQEVLNTALEYAPQDVRLLKIRTRFNP